jgi:hypothetical protein
MYAIMLPLPAMTVAFWFPPIFHSPSARPLVIDHLASTIVTMYYVVATLLIHTQAVHNNGSPVQYDVG